MYYTITEEAPLEDIRKAFDQLNARMCALEAAEPEDENSPAYEQWERECDDLAFRSEELMTWIDRKMAAGL